MKPKPTAPPNSNSPPGLLLVGHGTRDRLGQEEFRQFAEKVQIALPDWVVAPCFLEFVEPTIGQGMTELVSRGCQEVAVMPLLLFTAGHALRDIPQAVRAQADLRGVDFQMLAPLGCNPHVLQLSQERHMAAIDEGVSSDSTAWIFVGRGSQEEGAAVEFREFFALRRQLQTLAASWSCVLARSSPSLEEVLPLVSANQFSQVIVQPHLLFHGQLLDRMKKMVFAHAERVGGNWQVASPLGGVDGIVSAVCEAVRGENS